MKITLKNYEVYFVDYMDGKLNSEQLSELGLFLNLHPELKETLLEDKTIVLQPEKIHYKNKNFINKFDFDTAPIHASNFDDFCIAYCEQLLSEEKSKEFLKHCSENTIYQINLESYKKAYLKPPTSIGYPNKKLLYKKSGYRKLYASIALGVTSIAASLLIVISIISHRTPVVKNLPLVVVPEKKINTQPIIKVKAQVVNKKILINNTIKKEAVIAEPVEETQMSTASTIVAEKDTQQQKIPLLKPNLLESNNLLAIKKVSIQLEDAIAQQANKEMESDKNILKNIEAKVSYLKEQTTNHKKLSLFKIAQLGIKGINSLTDSKMSLTEKVDSTKNITALSFTSDLVEFHRSKSN